MLRALCGRKVANKKTTCEQMDVLGSKKTVEGPAKANGVDDANLC